MSHPQSPNKKYIELFSNIVDYLIKWARIQRRPAGCSLDKKFLMTMRNHQNSPCTVLESVRSTFPGVFSLAASDGHLQVAVKLGYLIKLIYHITCLFIDFQCDRSNDKSGYMPFLRP